MSPSTRTDNSDKQGAPLDYATQTRSTARRDVDTAAIALVVGAGFALWTVFQASGIHGVPFAVWVASPYLVLAGMAWHGGGGSLVRTILLLAVVGSAIFGMGIYPSVRQHAQGAIAFVVVPLYQLGAVGFLCFCILVSRRIDLNRRPE